MVIKLEIALTNKWLHSLIIVGVLLILATGVWAYQSGQIPSVYGHSSEELEITINQQIKSLQQAINDGDFARADISDCKVCIACSDDIKWNGMVVCDGIDNDGWHSSATNFCADNGRLAIKFVCGTDSYSDTSPNSAA